MKRLQALMDKQRREWAARVIQKHWWHWYDNRPR